MLMYIFSSIVDSTAADFQFSSIFVEVDMKKMIEKFVSHMNRMLKNEQQLRAPLVIRCLVTLVTCSGFDVEYCVAIVMMI